MKKKDTISESDLWSQAAEIYLDIDTHNLEPLIKSSKFTQLLIKNKFKLTKKVKDEIYKNRFDQMFLIHVSANLAHRNLATDFILDEIWSPFFENELIIFVSINSCRILINIRNTMSVPVLYNVNSGLTKNYKFKIF